MKDIKNIIFDLGGVIVDLDVRASMTAFSRLGLTPPGVSLEQLSSGGIPKDWAMRKLMHAMDIGQMDATGFVATLLPQCRPGTTGQDIIDAYNQLIRLPRQRLERIQQLSRRYRLFLLSNLGDIHWQETQRQAAAFGIPFEGCFEQLFLSFQLHMVKPDPAIFRHLTEATGIVPEETLYIDDLPDNIEAGRQLGFKAYKIACNGLDEVCEELFCEKQ